MTSNRNQCLLSPWCSITDWVRALPLHLLLEWCLEEPMQKVFRYFIFFHDLFVGILAGYVAGTIPVCLSVVGLLFIPRHASFLNQTTKSIATCASNISTTEGKTSKSLFLTLNIKFHYALVTSINDDQDESYPSWHTVFWVSPLYTGKVSISWHLSLSNGNPSFYSTFCGYIFHITMHACLFPHETATCWWKTVNSSIPVFNVPILVTEFFQREVVSCDRETDEAR